MKLYEIANQMNEFLEMIEAEEIPEEAISDTLESISLDFEEKADNIACLIKNYNSDIEAIKKEKEALDTRIKRKQKQAEWLKSYLSEQFALIGKDKLETPRNAISFRKSERLIIPDKTAFIEAHKELCKVDYKIDSAGVKKMIKDGQEIDGATVEIFQNIQIK